MTLLLSLHALEERSRVARGELAGLQSSLLADLSQAMSIEVQLPGKARLTRRGGRCEVDSTLLEFNPASPHDHRCPACGRLYKGAEHHQWWAMGMQLWLAERAVHAAALNALTPMPQYARWAADLLIQLAGRYSSYPNSDNVLGPSRPFFSTYLESLWLLHICIALDLLEMAEEGGGGSIGDEVRERLIQPSAELIASFNEGASNRQLWNSTALTAANLQLGRADRAAEWAEGKHGILHQLTNGFMPDGTWYEGENYHQFALRGLWYGLTMFEEMGGTLADSLNERWRLASLAPFAVALPDFTLPARKDSQWATSLRQWRFAEHAELTFARWPNDPQIAGALGQLYATDVPVGDTGRSRSTGEAERNVPPSRLTREDLGWKSLLFALAELPEFQPLPPQSILQADQGYAVVRRDSGNIYAALDYGSSGGGHGHPDHLNLVLQQGGVRWFDDPGTGSYTDPTLSWYRSSLAHNVPLPDGRTQKRVPAQLLRFLSEIGVTLAAAQANGIVPGARVRRVLCVLDGYLIDHLEWSSAHTAFLDLPMHVPLELADASEWTTGDPTPDSLPDIGYSFLEDAKYAVSAAGVSRVSSVMGKDRLLGWLAASSQPVFWRANAPAAPGSGCSTRQMAIVRVPGARGRLTTVWSWSDAVADVRIHSERDPRRARKTPVAGRTAASHAAPGTGESPTGVLHMEVVAPDESTHRHSLGDTEWLVETEQSGNRKVVRISINEDSHDGAAFMPNATNALAIDSNASRTTLRIPTLPNDAWSHSARSLDTAAIAIELGPDHWRGTEQSWEQAGMPSARARLAVIGDSLAIEIDVRKKLPYFAPQLEENPLDNEHPDINSDGIQLHIASRDDRGEPLVWIMVPVAGGESVRVTPRTSFAARVNIAVRWWNTSSGWALRADVPVVEIASGSPARFAMDVIVNEMPPERERRRGQLVLSGAHGETAWLRGDRQDTARFLTMEVHG